MSVSFGPIGACVVATLLLLAEVSSQAAAQTAPASPLPDRAAATFEIPRDTVIHITIEKTLQSGQSAPGDKFPIRLAAPLMIGGRELLPVGLIGQGEVIDTKKSGGGGAAGGIVTNARFLVCGAVRVPVGKMHLSAGGKDNAALSAAVSAGVGPFALFIKGRNAVIPQGAAAEAKVIADTILTGPCAVSAPVQASQ